MRSPWKTIRNCIFFFFFFFFFKVGNSISQARKWCLTTPKCGIEILDNALDFQPSNSAVGLGIFISAPPIVIQMIEIRMLDGIGFSALQILQSKHSLNESLVFLEWNFLLKFLSFFFWNLLKPFVMKTTSSSEFSFIVVTLSLNLYEIDLSIFLTMTSNFSGSKSYLGVHKVLKLSIEVDDLLIFFHPKFLKLKGSGAKPLSGLWGIGHFCLESPPTQG